MNQFIIHELKKGVKVPWVNEHLHILVWQTHLNYQILIKKICF